MHLQMTRDALGDEDIPDEILKRELALDKELVQLIQTACKNDKLPRVLELTLLLHHTSSFDMAIKVAAFYRLVGLQEKIQALKDDRIARGRPQKRDWTRDYDPMLPTRLPPADIPRGGESKVFQNFGPPVPVHRPGLARATPSLPPPKDDVWNEDYAVTATVPGESKRKRADDDTVAYGEAEQPDSIKRRAVEDEEYALPLPSKPSAHVFSIFSSHNHISVACSCSHSCSHSSFILLSMQMREKQRPTHSQRSPAEQRMVHGIRSREIIRSTCHYTRARVSLTKPKLPKRASGKVCPPVFVFFPERCTGRH